MRTRIAAMTATPLLTLALATSVFAATTLLAPAAMAANTTTITFNVVGCDGCTIQPAQWLKGKSGAPYEGKTVTVVNGVATATVPTSKTKGMSFNFTAPWAVNQNALQNIVIQYKGVPAGTQPTRAEALDSTKASGCWAGAKSGNVTIQINVGRVTMEGFPASVGKGPYPLVYVVPPIASQKVFQPTYKGTIGNQQGALPCSSS